ncbi:MAG: bicyclomycin resistance protein [Rubrivivax sp.]|nr:bicyclomycin resistance protein [Rubrivivax sp.]
MTDRLNRRQAALGLALVPLSGAALSATEKAAVAATVASQKKVLRYAFRIAETGFDPAQVNDLYSRTITPHIFECLYQYDHLARPAKIKPLTADGMPVHSDDYRTWTFKVRPGIFFMSDPAFKGQKRELVAEDYVYSLKRFADPKNKSPVWGGIEVQEILGLNDLHKKALASGKFDFDTPIEGLRTLDRYTFQVKMKDPDPRHISSWAASDLFGAVAREVVEFYGADIPAHPVGTGPFKLVQWRRSSLIVLERNPEFREVLWDAEPAADDAYGQALAARLKGKRLPLVDRVEVSIIEEQQPRWLSFLQKGSDLIEEVPPEFIDKAMPGGKVLPGLARQGIQGWRVVRSDSAYTYFNMEDPTVGGYTPEKVALRRAIGLGLDVEREIRLVRRGQAITAQSPVLPHSYAFNNTFRSENGEYNLPRAKALLDMFGYADKDGDGYREMPDGSPLLLRKSTQPDQQSRQLDEQWRRDMNALNIRIEFVPAKWPENLKAGRAGKLMMWGLGGSGAGFDSLGSLARYDSRQIGGQNFARFKLPKFDELYDRLGAMPDSPERLALFEEAKRLAVVYMPYKHHCHRYYNDMAHPWVIGYRRPLFWNEYWQFLDIDNSLKPQA